MTNREAWFKLRGALKSMALDHPDRPDAESRLKEIETAMFRSAPSLKPSRRSSDG